MSIDEVLLFFYLMMISGWLPPCHEGAAVCRPDRFLLSVSSFTSSLAHLHASSLLQLFFSIEIQHGFQSHIHFTKDSKENPSKREYVVREEIDEHSRNL